MGINIYQSPELEKNHKHGKLSPNFRNSHDLVLGTEKSFLRNSSQMAKESGFSELKVDPAFGSRSPFTSKTKSWNKMASTPVGTSSRSIISNTNIESQAPPFLTPSDSSNSQYSMCCPVCQVLIRNLLIFEFLLIAKTDKSTKRRRFFPNLNIFRAFVSQDKHVIQPNVDSYEYLHTPTVSDSRSEPSRQLT